MVEVGALGTVVFTEVKDRQLKPFSLTDSAGNPLSGVLPLNSRPVLGAGGFQLSARESYHFRSDRFSFSPEGTYGMAWGSTYSTLFLSLTGNTAVNFANGNARIIAKAGYGLNKISSNTADVEVRQGVKLGLEVAFRVTTGFDLSTQVGVILTPDGPQTTMGFGLQWLSNNRPVPPTELDGSLGRQSLATAAQQLDHMDHIYAAAHAMAEMGVGPKDAPTDQLLTLNGITSAFINNESYASIPPINDELAKAGLLLDNASNAGVNISLLSPYRRRINDFKEIKYTEILKFAQELLDAVEQKQCHKAAELVESGDYELAKTTLTTCIENLTMLQALSNKLEPVLSPLGKVEVATLQRKMTCLLKAEKCTNDIDPEKTIPAIQKKITPKNDTLDWEMNDSGKRKKTK